MVIVIFRPSRQRTIRWSFGHYGALVPIRTWYSIAYEIHFMGQFIIGTHFELSPCTIKPIGLSRPLWQVADSRIQFGHKITKYGCPRLTKMCARDYSRWSTCILSVKNQPTPSGQTNEDKTTVSVRGNGQLFSVDGRLIEKPLSFVLWKMRFQFSCFHPKSKI